jgi:hypothetical protein
VISISANRLQRGFIYDRQMLQNVVDLDAHARIQAMRARDLHGDQVLDTLENCSALTFWDFATAFPSVNLTWLHLALRAAGVPKGLRRLVAALYTSNAAFARVDGSDNFLFWVTSGVLQGCPSLAPSSSCALTLRLNKLEADTFGRAQIRVCADDIGAAAASIPTLAAFYPTFVAAKTYAGLDLKPPKCDIVPTSHPFSPDIIEELRLWLLINIPPWSGFKISDSAKYLVFLGPRSWRQIVIRASAQAGGPLSRHCSHGRRRPQVFLSLQRPCRAYPRLRRTAHDPSR